MFFFHFCGFPLVKKFHGAAFCRYKTSLLDDSGKWLKKQLKDVSGELAMKFLQFRLSSRRKYPLGTTAMITWINLFWTRAAAVVAVCTQWQSVWQVSAEREKLDYYSCQFSFSSHSENFSFLFILMICVSIIIRCQLNLIFFFFFFFFCHILKWRNYKIL